MAMKKGEIEEKLILAKSAAMVAIQVGDYDKLITIKAEMRDLGELLRRRSPVPPSLARIRGNKPVQLNRVVELMVQDRSEGVMLENLKEEMMAARYGASRGTCRKARNKVLMLPVNK
jgi:hypothetical protein